MPKQTFFNLPDEKRETIINAENMDEAEQIARTCPIITSMRIYEAMSM